MAGRFLPTSPHSPGYLPPFAPQGPLLRSVPRARGIRSLSPSAALRGAATPPWTPFCSTGSAPSERSPCQGDPQLVPLRCAPGGCYSPLDPLLLHRVRSFGAFPVPVGSAACPPPPPSAGLLLPPGPPFAPQGPLLRSVPRASGIRSLSPSAALRGA